MWQAYISIWKALLTIHWSIKLWRLVGDSTVGVEGYSRSKCMTGQSKGFFLVQVWLIQWRWDSPDGTENQKWRKNLSSPSLGTRSSKTQLYRNRTKKGRRLEKSERTFYFHNLHGNTYTLTHLLLDSSHRLYFTTVNIHDLQRWKFWRHYAAGRGGL